MEYSLLGNEQLLNSDLRIAVTGSRIVDKVHLPVITTVLSASPKETVFVVSTEEGFSRLFIEKALSEKRLIICVLSCSISNLSVEVAQLVSTILATDGLVVDPFTLDTPRSAASVFRKEEVLLEMSSLVISSVHPPFSELHTAVAKGLLQDRGFFYAAPPTRATQRFKTSNPSFFRSSKELGAILEALV